MALIPIWVIPGSTRDVLSWNPWRKHWVVTCRARAIGGEANRAVAILVADWLGVPHSSVRWAKGGSTRAKVLSADGVTDAEVVRSLSARATATGHPRTAGSSGGQGISGRALK